MFSKTVGTGVIGSLSGEFAGITELGWEAFTGHADWDTEFNILFGDLEEVEKRIMTNALVFGVAGQFNKRGRFKRSDIAITKNQKLNLMSKLYTKKEELLYSEKERKIRKEWRKLKEKNQQDYYTGKYGNPFSKKAKNKRDATNELIDMNLGLGGKETIKGGVGKFTEPADAYLGKKRKYEDLSQKEKNQYDAYSQAYQSVQRLFLAQVYASKMDMTTESGRKLYEQQFLQPINKVLKKANPNHKDVTVEWIDNATMKTRINKGTWEEGSVAYYDPIKDKLIYNYEKFEVGTSSHELVHMALRQYFNAQGQRMEINFRNRLEKEFELAFGVTLSQKLGQVVKREYKVDPTDLNKIETKYENLKEKVNKRYKNKKISKSEHKKEIKKLDDKMAEEMGKAETKTAEQEFQLQQEEFLSNMAELLTNPEIYYSEFANTFFKNAKQQVIGFLEEIAPGSKLSEYFKPKDTKEFVMFLGRLGEAGRMGGRLAGKISNLTKIEGMSWMEVEYKENLRDKKLAGRNLSKEVADLTQKKPKGWQKEVRDLNLKIETNKKNVVLLDKYKSLPKEGARSEKNNIFREIKSNNQHIINDFVDNKYRKLGTISKKDFKSYVENVELLKLINTYTPKLGEFGMYLANVLPFRMGNILKYGFGVSKEQLERTSYIEDMKNNQPGFDIKDKGGSNLLIPNTGEKGPELLQELPIKKSTIDVIKKEIRESFDIVGDVATKSLRMRRRGEILDAYTLKDLTPKQTKEMFGKNVQQRANTLANYWKTIFDCWPKNNLTLMEGKMKGIENSLMEGSVKNPGAGFWKKTGETVKFKGTGARTGTEVQEKIPHSKKEGLAKFGIVDNRTATEIANKTGNVDISGMNRNQKETLLPAAMNRTGVAITHQVVSESLSTLPGVQGRNVLENLRNTLAGKNLAKQIMKDIFDKKIISYSDIINEAKFAVYLDRYKDEYTKEELRKVKEDIHNSRELKEIINEADLKKQGVEEKLIVEERAREKHLYKGENPDIVEARNMKGVTKIINDVLKEQGLGTSIDYKPMTGKNSYASEQEWREIDYKISVKFLNKFNLKNGNIFSLLTRDLGAGNNKGEYMPIEFNTPVVIKGKKYTRYNLPRSKTGFKGDRIEIEQQWCEKWLGQRVEGKNVTKKGFIAEDVYVANPGKVKEKVTKFLLENALKGNKGLKGKQLDKALHVEYLSALVSTKTKKKYSGEKNNFKNINNAYNATLTANKKLREIYFENINELINDAYKETLKKDGNKNALKETVEWVLRHSQRQTTIGEGIQKGTFSIKFGSTVLGKPVTVNYGGKKVKVYFHSEHNLQLLNYTLNNMKITLEALGNKEAYKMAEKMDKSKNEYKEEIKKLDNKNKEAYKAKWELLDREAHQAVVPKELQKIYDVEPTKLDARMSDRKLGEISSIINFLAKPGVTLKVLYLPGKHGETVGEYLVRSFNENQVKTVLDIVGKQNNVKIKEAKLLLEKKTKGMYAGKNAFSAEQIRKAEIIDKAISEGMGKVKKRRGISVWDLDDTLIRSKSGVKANIPNPSMTPMPGRKVIFMAGGAGSGKSNIIKQLGLKEQGFKVVNQDISLQWLAKNHGLPKDMREFTREQSSKWGSLSWEAMNIAKNKQAKFQGRGDGIVVDGTGNSLITMKNQVQEFKNKGYDVQMVFVETSLSTALQRNKLREERSLLDNIVVRNHGKVQGNKKAFKELFGENFAEIKTDNIKINQPLNKKFVENVDKFTKSYENRRLTTEEFALEGERILDKGGEFNFSEFNRVVEGEKGPFWQKAINRIKKFGNKDNFILTARPHAAKNPIFWFLQSRGLKIPRENIITLESSLPESKALWVLEKFKEGYNDFYFADDAIKNVKAVKHVLDQLDVKSKIQQARASKGLSLSKEFNEIIEDITGLEAFKKVSDKKAFIVGKGRRQKSLIHSDGQDFMGLMQNFMGKGKKGEAQQKWFEDNLQTPYAKGMDQLNSYKQRITDDFKRLKTLFPELNPIGKNKINGTKYRSGAKDFNAYRKIPGSVFTYEHAMRVYLWNKMGINMKEYGLSKSDNNKLLDVVNKDPVLKEYAEQLSKLSKQPEGYIKPREFWTEETILSDMFEITQNASKGVFLKEFIENKNLIFSKENMNKIEYTQGRVFREALEDILYRMETGSNRPGGSSKALNVYLNWINGAVGATMFLNMKSAVMQQLSSANFINWHDNNPVKAAKAFVNQKQFWKDYATIWNSDMLVQRRGGLRINVQEAEIALAASNSKSKSRAVFSYLLKLGYTPTKISDSHAISFGGASFYRNRINTYLKQGMNKTAAEKKAFLDFQAASEPVQQSSRPDLISKWQAGPLGRLILAWGNTQMQNVRTAEKSTRNIINRRGSDKENLSKIWWYGAMQPLMYGALSAGLFAIYLDEDDIFDDQDKKDKTWMTVNTMMDSQLRGFGVPGALVSTVKNTALEYHKQDKKGWDADHTYTMIQMAGFSPPVSSKARKIYQSFQTVKFNEDVVSEMGWTLDNPAFMAGAQLIEGVTNWPAARTLQKRLNIKESLDENNQYWQRIATGFGFPAWSMGTKIESIEEAKEAVKQKKKKEKEEKKKKKKYLRVIN